MIVWLAKAWNRSGPGALSLSTVRIAAISLFLGTLVMVLSLATVHGFRKAIRMRAAAFVGHLVVQSYGASDTRLPFLEEDPQLVGHLRLLPDIVAVNPVLTRPAIVKTGDDITGVMVKGVASDFNGLGIFRVPPPGWLYISRLLAQRLGLDSSATAKVYFLTPDTLGGLTLRLPRTYQVAVGYHTGLQELDEALALASLEDLREVFCPPGVPCVTSYECHFNHPPDPEVAERISLLLPPDVSLLTTRDILPQLHEWLDYLDVNIFIISALLLAVGLLSTAAAFLTLVLERGRAVALLRALGMAPRLILATFAWRFAGIVLISVVLGDLVALGLITVQTQFSLVPLDPETYYLDTVPMAWDGLRTLLINGLSIVLAGVAMLIPAIYIWRMRISQALRME
ncbi:MAG: hypothetical protein N2110_01210 [Flavobacteriales bacterium]|nr:hypothetical protein [Flavobacteriales bacterium]